MLYVNVKNIFCYKGKGEIGIFLVYFLIIDKSTNENDYSLNINTI